ncbi:complex I intermediate-associated protein 30-domain-containing protein [Paraphysoderma sedebokerense]|nr:complex I intermediate-associated protein 30-domain-containing protein [Paraphysoderma sedebokerense]
MASGLFSFLKRSLDTVGRDAGKERSKTLYNLHSKNDVQKWVVGSDKDIGGYSNAKFDWVDGFAKFHGSISHQIPPNTRVAKSGYAAIKAKKLPYTLFGHPTHDVSDFRFIMLRLKSNDALKRQYYVNIQVDSYVEEDLYQFPLLLDKRIGDGGWMDVMIPFRSFVLTHRGFILSHQRPIPRSSVLSVGLSTTTPGSFDLQLDSIRTANPEGESEAEIERDLMWKGEEEWVDHLRVENCQSSSEEHSSTVNTTMNTANPKTEKQPASDSDFDSRLDGQGGVVDKMVEKGEVGVSDSGVIIDKISEGDVLKGRLGDTES